MDNLVSIFNASTSNAVNFKDLTIPSYCDEIMKHTSMIFDYLYANRGNDERRERRRILIDCANNSQLGFILTYMKEQFFDLVIEAPNVQLFYKQPKKKSIAKSSSTSQKNSAKKNDKSSKSTNKKKQQTKKMATKTNKKNKNSKTATPTTKPLKAPKSPKSPKAPKSPRAGKPSKETEKVDMKTPEFGADNVWVCYGCDSLIVVCFFFLTCLLFVVCDRSLFSIVHTCARARNI